MVRLYEPSAEQEWNRFIRESRNGTFLFDRRYMDYHKDRFSDHSLMFYEKGRLVAVLPANVSGDTLYSHQGLTYGGLILKGKAYSSEVRQCFDELLSHMRDSGLSTLKYKEMPTIYHKVPSQEEEFFLWSLGAEIERCGLSTTIDLSSDLIKEQSCRRYARSSCRRTAAVLNTNASLESFWTLLSTRLNEKYGVNPVHSISEIQYLKQSFPENILCCSVEDNEQGMLAGVVLFICGQTVHVQYAATSVQGRKRNAQDFLHMELVHHFSSQTGIRYYDFGISNNGDGSLNGNLIKYKESFGGRGVAYKQWRLDVQGTSAKPVI